MRPPSPARAAAVPVWVALVSLTVAALFAICAPLASGAGDVAFVSSRGEPDGAAFVGHNPAIWTVKDDGTQMRRLTSARGEPLDGSDPTWSPLGNAIAFSHNGPGDPPAAQLSVVSGDGLGRRVIVSDAQAGFRGTQDPDWSPDGRWIAFSAYTRDRFGVDSARLWQSDIYLASADGAHVRRLTGRGPGGEKLYDEEPSFSPDGRRILFNRTTESTSPGKRPPGSGLYSVGLDGGEPEPVFVGEFPSDGKYGGGIAGIRSASFSPDGREIAFLVSDALYTVGSDGSNLRRRGTVGSEMIFNTSVVPIWDPALAFIVAEPFKPLVKVYSEGRTDSVTTIPANPELRAEFQGDLDPDWRPSVPIPPLPDIRPPATFLFDRARPRPLATAAAATRRRSLTLRRGNLSFFAIDSAGVSAVHVAVARGTQRRRGRPMCRFLGARRFSRRSRPCARPVYRRFSSPRAWPRLSRLRTGRYLIWLRTTDGRGTRTRARAVHVRLRR